MGRYTYILYAAVVVAVATLINLAAEANGNRSWSGSGGTSGGSWSSGGGGHK